MSEITTLDSKGRITISKKLRMKYGLDKGSIIVLIPLEEGILIKPIKDPMRRLSEILRGITWNREMRKSAEKWMLEEAKGEKKSY